MADIRVTLPGVVVAELSCPRCGSIAETSVRLNSRLVADDDDSGTLGVRARSVKVPHLCGQTSLTLTFDAETADDDDEG